MEPVKISKPRPSSDPLLSSSNLKDLVASTLDADKAEDIEIIDIKNQSSIADYMIVATGRSSRAVSALAEKLMDKLAVLGIKNTRTEGLRNGDWVVVDVGDIIVHIFRPEVREFYNIEKMWRAGELFETAGATA